MRNRIIIITILIIILSATTSFATEYKDLLSMSQSNVYEQMCENIKHHKEGWIDVNGNISYKDFEEVMECIYYDHIDYYYLDSSYSYKVANGIVKQVKFSYYDNKEDFKKGCQVYEDTINTIVNNANKLKTIDEKIDYINGKICCMTTYNLNAPYYQSSYSVFVNGESVCAGYSKAFKEICDRLGIECYYLTGECYGGSHCWNMVVVNGKKSYYDVTFNDREDDGYDYEYYDVSLEFMDSNHKLGKLSEKLLKHI